MSDTTLCKRFSLVKLERCTSYFGTNRLLEIPKDPEIEEITYFEK